MTKLEVKELANDLMEKHGLIDRGWTFEFINHKNRLGSCNYIWKKIKFSTWHLYLSREKITQVLLHEIAHSLAGANAGHNKQWKKKCMEIGVVPERLIKLNYKEVAPKAKYNVVCPKCGLIGILHRKHKNRYYTCKKCYSEVKIIQNY